MPKQTALDTGEDMRPVRVKWAGGLVVLCNHKRPDGAPKPSCGHHGADDLRSWLKLRLREEGLWGRVRVATGSCLDVCPKAGVIVSLPEENGDSQVFLMDADLDREALLEKLKGLAPETHTESENNS